MSIEQILDRLVNDSTGYGQIILEIASRINVDAIKDSRDNIVNIYNDCTYIKRDLREKKLFDSSSGISAHSWSLNGKDLQLFYKKNDKEYLFELKTDGNINLLAEVDGSFDRLSFSPDQKKAAIVHRTVEKSGNTKLGFNLHELEGAINGSDLERDSKTALYWSPDSRAVAVHEILASPAIKSKDNPYLSRVHIFRDGDYEKEFEVRSEHIDLLDNKTIIYELDGDFRTYDIEEGISKKILEECHPLKWSMSPDKKHVAYEAYKQDTGQEVIVYVKNLDGQGVAWLNMKNVSSWQWFPDSKGLLAYARYRFIGSNRIKFYKLDLKNKGEGYGTAVTYHDISEPLTFLIQPEVKD